MPKSKPKNLPYFEFYPGDWKKNPAVQKLSFEARGLYIELLCFMHEASSRGYLEINGETPSKAEIERLFALPPKRLWKLFEELIKSGLIVKSRGKLCSPKMVERERYRKQQSGHGKRGGGNPKLRDPDDTETIPKPKKPAKQAKQNKGPRVGTLEWNGQFYWQSQLEKILKDAEAKLSTLQKQKPVYRQKGLLSEYNKHEAAIRGQILELQQVLGYVTLPQAPEPATKTYSQGQGSTEDKIYAEAPKIMELERLVMTAGLRIESLDYKTAKEKLRQATEVVEWLSNPDDEHRNHYYGSDGKLRPMLQDKFDRWTAQKAALEKRLEQIEHENTPEPQPPTRKRRTARSSTATLVA